MLVFIRYHINGQRFVWNVTKILEPFETKTIAAQLHDCAVGGVNSNHYGPDYASSPKQRQKICEIFFF